MPNITGDIWDLLTNTGSNGNMGSVTGAFYASYNGPIDRGAIYGTSNLAKLSNTGDGLGFDASLSSPIYGNSSTVQPPAVKLLPCIKAYSDVDNLGSLDVAQLENYVQNNFVHLTGDESISGEKTFVNSKIIHKRTDYNRDYPTSDCEFNLIEAKDVNNNKLARLMYRGESDKDHAVAIHNYKPNSENYGSIWIQYTFSGDQIAAGVSVDVFRPTAATYPTLGASGSYRWGQIYSTSSTISTSDERSKESISNIPDSILDIWGECEFYQFKMIDAVHEKGDENARIHTGMVAQRIKQKFDDAKLDISKYGLFCHDSWDAAPASDIEPAVEAGDEYSLRYEEALCMESAYQRRRADRAEARIANLEEEVSSLKLQISQLINSLK